MTLEVFNDRLNIIKEHVKQLDKQTEDLIQTLRSTFIEDCDGVPKSWLFDIVTNEFINLVMAVLPEAEWSSSDIDEVKDFFDYYGYEQDFSGRIDTLEDPEDPDSKVKKTYDLEKVDELFAYINEELLSSSEKDVAHQKEEA